MCDACPKLFYWQWRHYLHEEHLSSLGSAVMTFHVAIFADHGRWHHCLDTQQIFQLGVIVAIAECGPDIRRDSDAVGGPWISAEFASGSSASVTKFRIAVHKNLQRKCTLHAASVGIVIKKGSCVFDVFVLRLYRRTWPYQSVSRVTARNRLRGRQAGQAAAQDTNR